MTLSQLKVLVKTSNKVFIWSTLSETHSAYFNISKATILDYLDSIDSTNSAFNVELDEVGDLYLGAGND
ncbi:hypothetical protein C4588_05665 [Candidatus Parcubacteria bacterium]|nr:MAG: hypothetical protein C4588_05665 [Candidatus Parcubacteria bacterium]